MASTGVFGLASTASGATLNANPGTLDGVFAGAGGGDTIELAAGDYGTFTGALKSGPVTLTPQPGAAVTMALDFAPASNIIIDGVTLTEAALGDTTHDIIVRNSDVPGQVTFRTGELANANILFERNVHRDFDPDGGGEGRIYLPESTDQPSGITIRNSEFRGGTADGIQNGSNGTVILNNDFHDFETGQGPHTDAIQLYGSRNTVIRGNYFHDLGGAPPIMAPDGADHELIEDNVVKGDAGGYPYAISLGSDNGSIIRHNTFADGPCDYDLHCGILAIGAKEGEPEGRGTVVQDNILGEISIESSTLAERSHNLIAHDRAAAPAEIEGRPRYVGGANPVTYTGYALADRSLGSGNASDGFDRGARIDVSDCQKAVAKVKTAKAKVKKAKKALRRADGGKQTAKAKKKLKRAKKKLKRAKQKQREAC